MQERALRLIDNRITHLQNLLTKINSDKNLSDSEKSALANEINSLTANLSNLKAKVGSTTSTQELQSIIRETVKLNVYGFYVQKIRLTIIIRELTALTEKISNLAANLQNLVNQEKAQGKDVTLLQNSLDDIQKRLGTIRSMLTADSAKLASATPENARSIFPVIRADLAKVRAEFAQIRADLARMRKDFRTIRNAASPKTSSPSSTISP
jgi:DNA repair exonuclease SbcCD ATPase subunit